MTLQALNLEYQLILKMTKKARKYKGRLGLYKGVQPNLFLDGKYWRRDEIWPSPVIAYSNNSRLLLLEKDSLNNISTDSPFLTFGSFLPSISKNNIIVGTNSLGVEGGRFATWDMDGNIIFDGFIDVSAAPTTPNVNILRSAPDLNNNVIILTQNEIYKVNQSGVWIETLTTSNLGISNTAVNAMFVDINGNIYFDQTNNIFCYSNTGIQLWSYSVGAGTHVIHDIDREGNVLIRHGSTIRVIKDGSLVNSFTAPGSSVSTATPTVFLQDGRIATYRRNGSSDHPDIMIYSRTGTLLNTINIDANSVATILPDYNNTFWAIYIPNSDTFNRFSINKYSNNINVDSKILDGANTPSSNRYRTKATFKPI
jgi:hypothetical protein